MVALAGEISDGMVFANGARSHMATRSPRCRRANATMPASSSATCSRPASATTSRRPRRYPQDADPLRVPAELPQLLEGSGLRRGDGRRSRRPSPRSARDDVPKYLTDAGLPTAPCSVRGPGARGRRGLVRRRRAHARHRALLGQRQPDEGDRGDVRDVHGLTLRLERGCRRACGWIDGKCGREIGGVA